MDMARVPQPYALLYRESVQKDLRKIPDALRKRVIEKIAALKMDPRPEGCVKLHSSAGLYRIRQGTYRIIYQIDDGNLIVLVVKTGHRREVYRDT